MFQDSGSDIRMHRLQLAGVALIELLQQEDAPASGPVMLRPAESSQPCASGCADKSTESGGIRFGSIQEALLEIAFAQWRRNSAQLPGCTCGLRELLERQRPRLACYMQALRSRLPAAVAEWRTAGMLYDTSPGT